MISLNIKKRYFMEAVTFYDNKESNNVYYDIWTFAAGIDIC